MDIDRGKIDRYIERPEPDEWFGDLIPNDTIIITPKQNASGEFLIKYPRGYTESEPFKQLYRELGDIFPMGCTSSGVLLLTENASRFGITVVIEPHPKWFQKGGDANET